MKSDNVIDVGLLRQTSGNRCSLQTKLFAGMSPVPQLPFNTMLNNYPVARLANLSTGQSNVFAVRATIGSLSSILPQG